MRDPIWRPQIPTFKSNSSIIRFCEYKKAAIFIQRFSVPLRKLNCLTNNGENRRDMSDVALFQLGRIFKIEDWKLY